MISLHPQGQERLPTLACNSGTPITGNAFRTRVTRRERVLSLIIISFDCLSVRFDRMKIKRNRA